jgi:integrase
MGKPFQRKDRKDKDWYISYYEPSGRRIRRRIGSSKKLAEAALKKIEVEIAEGKYLDIRKQGRIKFEDFLDEYFKLHSRNLKSGEKNHMTYGGQFKQIFGGKFLSEIKVVDIEQFKTQQLKDSAPATVNRKVSFLRSVFNKAIAWDKYHGINPVSKVKFLKENNTRLRYFEKGEIVRLLSNCEGSLKQIVSIALNTGMRRGELFNLKWADVDFAIKVIYLRETKSGESREIPMNEEVYKILKGMAKNPKSEHVFCHENGQRILDIRKSFWTALEKSDIKDFHFHDLRHTFASQMVMSGIDLNTVRELMGHHSLEMTLRYAHLSPGHKRRAVDILGQNINAGHAKSRLDLVPIWSPEENLSKDSKESLTQLSELQAVI